MMKVKLPTIAAVVAASIALTFGFTTVGGETDGSNTGRAALVFWRDQQRNQEVDLWNRTVLWNDTVRFNEAVKANQWIAWNEAAAENERQALQRQADARRVAAQSAVPAAKQKKPAVATAKPTAAVTRTAPSPPSSVGGSCGGASNGADAYIGRESGGNPNARNPSGAWGCYQIMPGTWSGSCSDLGSHGAASTDAQAKCASRLPHNSWSSSGPTG